MTAGDEVQSQEELAAHYGEHGPVAPGYAFLDTVLRDEDFERAWPLLDPEFRLVRAQAWLWNNRETPIVSGEDLDELAAALAVEEPEVGLWLPFGLSELQQLLDVWKEVDVANIGAGSRPRPIGIDLEIVLFMPTDGEAIQFETATLAEGVLPFVMRQRDGVWRIAAYGDRLPTPGWPPDFGQVP